MSTRYGFTSHQSGQSDSSGSPESEGAKKNSEVAAELYAKKKKLQELRVSTCKGDVTIYKDIQIWYFDLQVYLLKQDWTQDIPMG